MRKIIFLFLLLLICTGFAQAQLYVNGTVLDSKDKSPIIGANVLLKNTTTGTITDIDGNFSLSEGGVVIVK